MMIPKRSNPTDPTLPLVIQSLSAAIAVLLILFVASSRPPRALANPRGTVSPTGRSTGDDFPVGNYRVGGSKMVVGFTSAGKYTVTSIEGELMAAGAYRIARGQIVFSDTADGESDASQKCGEPGKYKWSFDGKALIFIRIEDSCEGRVHTLAAGPCPAIKPER